MLRKIGAFQYNVSAVVTVFRANIRISLARNPSQTSKMSRAPFFRFLNTTCNHYTYKSQVKIRNDKCGICSKDVSQPRMLNCLHSFCSSCLKMILLNGRITCPDCGETTMIDNVGDLPYDYTKLSHTSRSTRYLNHKI